MQMEHRLTCVLALIYNEAEALFATVFSRNLRNFCKHIAYELGILRVHFGKKLKVVLGHG